MKTGFIHGFPNKPVFKYYSYHGTRRNCLIQPTPGTFQDEETEAPFGPEQLMKFDTTLPTTWEVRGFDYTTAHDEPEGQNPSNRVGARWYWRYNLMYYNLYRGFGAFTTWLLPECVITRAFFKAEGAFPLGSVPFRVVIRNGMPEWPYLDSRPANYGFDHYSGNGGSYYAMFGMPIEIELNAVGISWINKTGYTKFAFISQNDIDYKLPEPEEWISFSPYTDQQVLWVYYREPL